MTVEVTETLRGISIPVIIERYDEGYLAYNDDIRASASGATEEEALANFAAAVRDLVDEFGEEALKDVRPIVTRVVQV